MPSPMNTGETYIGDGLYVSIESDMVKLRAPRFVGDHVIYLEGPVLAAFFQWLTVNDIPFPEQEKRDGV